MTLRVDKLRLPAGFKLLRSLAGLLLVLALAGTLVAQGSLGEAERFARERDIEATKDQIRSLAANNQWADVIKATDHLLTIDPSNAQALFWKDKAERKMSATSGTGDVFTRPNGLPERPELIAPTPTPRPTPTPLPRIEAPPVSATTVRRSGAGLPMWLIIVIAVVAVVLLAVAIGAFISLRASRKRVAAALEEMQARAPKSQSGRKGIGDLPTAVGGAAVDATNFDPQTGAPDAPTMSENTDVMSALAYKPDEKSTYEVRSGIGMPDAQTSHQEPPPLPPPAPAPKAADTNIAAASQFPDVQEVKGDTFAPVSSSESLSLDLGPLSPPVASLGPPPSATAGGSPKEDPDALTFNSLMFANDQTQIPAAPKASAPAEDPDALTFNSLMFANDQTQVPGAAPAPAPAEDPDALTFNSLMFAGDQTGISSPPPAAPSGSGDTLSGTQFNNEYNNLMFGAGSEETKAGGIAPDQPTMPEIGEGIQLSGGFGYDPANEATLGPGGSADSETVRIEGGETGGAGTDPLFLRQKQNGMSALAAGDYERAVQCLTVAAGMRPGDAEVTANLEKARRLRDA